MEDSTTSYFLQTQNESFFSAMNKSNSTRFSMPLRTHFTNGDASILAALIIPMAIFGIFGNVTTFVVVYRTPSLRSIFNLYIMSLCISDLISAIISPLVVFVKAWGYITWNIPNAFCKIYYAGDMTTSISTSLHIVAFCALRYSSIARPHRFSKIKMMYAKISILCIWVVSIGCGFVPYALWMGVTVVDRTRNHFQRFRPACGIASSSPQWKFEVRSFRIYGFTIFCYIPLVLIIILSIAIAVSLLRKRTGNVQANEGNVKETELHRRKKENQAILQLALIVMSFLIGYLPISIFYIAIPTMSPRVIRTRWFWWLSSSTYICLRVSECLNPIFYNLASSKLRKATKRFFRKSCGCKSLQPSQCRNDYGSRSSSSNRQTCVTQM